MSTMLVAVLASRGVTAPLKIMPLGDSNTQGTGPGNGAYRTKLWQNFGSDPNKVVFYGSQAQGPPELGNKQHEGHSGYTIARAPVGFGNLTDFIGGYLHPRLFPDIILLMIGTNDINLNFEVQTAPQRLDHLISLISDRATGLRPNAKLIVSNILPIDDARNQFRSSSTDYSANERVATFNRSIPTIVEAHRARGEQVYFVDVNSAFTFADIADGLHPTLQGYDKLGDVWYRAILAVVPEPNSLAMLAIGFMVSAISRGPLGYDPARRRCRQSGSKAATKSSAKVAGSGTP